MMRYAWIFAMPLAGCLADPAEAPPETTDELQAPLLASHYYVDQVIGNDSNPGTEQKPFATVTAAFPVVRPGDIVHLRANRPYPYTFFFAPHLAGTAGAPITFQEWDPNTRPVFDPGVRDVRWERVPCPTPNPSTCHPDEWRSVDSYPWGATLDQPRGMLLDSKVRLVTYQRIEDLRASNQSLHQIKLSDPRPGPGPDLARPSHKHPWTYLGPGIFFVKDPGSTSNGHIHIRLSPTEIGAVGIENYNGPTDPNLVSISVTPKITRAAEIYGQHLVFKNIVFQNGGEWTVTVASTQTVTSSNVRFDHCEIRPGTHGVGVSYGSHDVKFVHTLFDGGVPPWMSRSDTKDGYKYLPGGQPCPANDPSKCENNLGKATADLLAKYEGSNGTYESCTFRRAHDAVMIRGQNIEIHGSLFEDVFDEAVQINNEVDRATDIPYVSSNIRVYQNVFRKTLALFRFNNAKEDEGEQPVIGGPVYIYRNVFDQRIPTRGYRALGKDTPEPFVYRWGYDLKHDGLGPIPPLYVYHNTFVGSHHWDKSSYQSQFLRPGPEPLQQRWFYNNIDIGLNLPTDYYHGFAHVPGRFQSKGNLWFRSPPAAPIFNLDNDAVGLGQLPAGWEQGSLFNTDPGFANFTDEYFDFQTAYPNTDFRPTQIHRGIPLDSSLPNPGGPGPNGPEMGALRMSDPPLTVGVDNSAVYPVQGVPVARAGADLVLADSNDDGFEQVTVNGNQSTDPGGSIVAYRWSIADKTVATTVHPTLYLPEGFHYLRLEVTDNQGLKDSDAIRIQIGPSPARDNLLRCPGFEDAACPWSLTPGAEIVSGSSNVHTGKNAVLIREGTVPRQALQRVTVTGKTVYRISSWVKATSLTDRAHVFARFFDAQGTDLGTVAVLGSFTGTLPYQYTEGAVTAPAAAASMDVFAQTGVLSGTGQLLLDDLRVRDSNLAPNGRVETRHPSGQDILSPPGWRFTRGSGGHGVFVVDEPGQRRSGDYAVALVGYSVDDYSQAEVVAPVTVGGRYHLSVWLKTVGLSQGSKPKINARFLAADGVSNLGSETLIGSALSPDRFSRIEGEVVAPQGAAFVRLYFWLGPGAQGSAYFDDALVEVVPTP